MGSQWLFANTEKRDTIRYILLFFLYIIIPQGSWQVKPPLLSGSMIASQLGSAYQGSKIGKICVISKIVDTRTFSLRWFLAMNCLLSRPISNEFYQRDLSPLSSFLLKDNLLLLCMSPFTMDLLMFTLLNVEAAFCYFYWP
ncbi:hypothetical protein FGO68_gene10400 [Halteria grandinella]|uniref:Uncharacterized protein n=1 Tax=Halteria grandinella TaxID=5974 RepID=A0A8J8NLT1_HALGN|nr:hypothetical protein FGO68_gene10400 [Halteria grandinella]